MEFDQNLLSQQLQRESRAPHRFFVFVMYAFAFECSLYADETPHFAELSMNANFTFQRAKSNGKIKIRLIVILDSAFSILWNAAATHLRIQPCRFCHKKLPRAKFKQHRRCTLLENVDRRFCDRKSAATSSILVTFPSMAPTLRVSENIEVDMSLGSIFSILFIVPALILAVSVCACCRKRKEDNDEAPRPGSFRD